MTSSEHNDMTGVWPVTGASGEHVHGSAGFPAPPAEAGGRVFTEEEVRRLLSATTPTPSMQAPPEQEDPYAVSTGWSRNTEDFVTPSGQRCLLKRLELPDLISAGLLDEMDSLGEIVDGNIRSSQGQPPVDVRKAMRNPSTIKTILPILDRVLKAVVVLPVLHDAPPQGEQRVEGRAYLDAVSLADKMAIFNRASGDMEDLKSFREEAD